MSKVYVLVDERLMAAKNPKRSRHPRHFVVAAYSTMKKAQEAADGYLEALSFAPQGQGWKQGKLKGEITKTESSGKKSDKYGSLHATYRDDEAVLGHLRILTLTVNQPPEDEIDYMTAEWMFEGRHIINADDEDEAYDKFANTDKYELSDAYQLVDVRGKGVFDGEEYDYGEGDYFDEHKVGLAESFNGEVYENAGSLNVNESFEDLRNMRYVSFPRYTDELLDSSLIWESDDGNARGIISYDAEVIQIPNFEISKKVRNTGKAREYLLEMIENAKEEYGGDFEIQVIDVDKRAEGFWQKMLDEKIIDGWNRGSYSESFGVETFNAESKFDKLAKEIAADYRKKGKSPEEALEIGEATAAKIGRAKFGKKKFARMGKKAENFYGAEQKGTTASGHKVEYGDGNISIEFAEPIGDYGARGMTGLKGVWSAGDKESPDRFNLFLQPRHIGMSFDVVINEVGEYGNVSDYKDSRWTVYVDYDMGTETEIFDYKVLDDKVVAAIEEGLNWMVGDIERIMGVRYGAEEYKGTTASGHTVEWDDGSIYIKFAEPIRNWKTDSVNEGRGYTSVTGEWYGGDNESPDKFSLTVTNPDADYADFTIDIDDVEYYGVSQNKSNRWQIDGDYRGNGPDIFVDMSDELVEAIEEGLNWMLGDLEDIMGVRYGAESVTNTLLPAFGLAAVGAIVYTIFLNGKKE